MIFAPRLSSAEIFNGNSRTISHNLSVLTPMQHDTITVTKSAKHQSEEDKKKIKEVAKSKKQPKPEKVEDAVPNTAKPVTKPKRQRRPEGLERPPEIPRRNN